MPQNEFKPFAIASSAAVLEQSEYEMSQVLREGFKKGLARSVEVNKAIRQASSIAAVVAEFAAEKSGKDMLDNGDVGILKENFETALSAVSSLLIAEALGTGDLLSASFTPKLRELKNGTLVHVRAKEKNLTKIPVFKADETGEKVIVKGNNLSLEEGDIAGAGHWLELQYDEALDKWVLQNPAKGITPSSGVPVGTIEYFAMVTSPAGYLKANGAAVGRETYPELYATIGTTFGEGDGSSTFNLPDLIDRFAQGSNTPGQKIEAGLPDHNHTLPLALEETGTGYAAHGSNISSGTTVGYASASNPIYGASNTVQPPALTLLPCIKAFDAYPAVQAGISAMNAIGAPTRAARATVEPHASKAWVNFDASSGEITIRNAHHVDKVIRVEKGAFDIIFDGSVQADCCTVTVSSSALVSAVNLDSFTGDYFPPSANRVRVVTASGFPIQPVDPADINVVVNQ